MTQRKRRVPSLGAALAAAALAASVSPAASAGTINDLAYGLDFVGFDLVGNKNPLTGGLDFSTFTTFRGNTLDFGPFDLTLEGPVSFEASYGGRVIRSLDLSFTTAAPGGGQPVPLDYTFNFDTGNQQTAVSGSLLMDGNFSINEFGFYDLQLRYSSRQTVDQSGRFADGSRQNDFDIGPINVSGNVFADILAAVFDPLFERSGAPNVFAQFSGREQLQRALFAESESFLADRPIPAAARTRADGSDGIVTALAALGGSAVPSSAGVRSVVPAPATLVLLVLSLPLILTGTWRRRRGGAASGRRGRQRQAAADLRAE